MALDVDQSDGGVVAGVDHFLVQSLLRGKNFLGEIAWLPLFFVQIDGSILKLDFLSRRHFVELLFLCGMSTRIEIGCLVIPFRQL